MGLEQVLSMTKGDGENSYMKASFYSQKLATMTKPIIHRVTQSLFQSRNIFPCDVLNIADLGCSSGPNTFLVMSTMLQSIANKCCELKIQRPEVQFYLNDLPSNDFNTLFNGLSAFCQKNGGDQGSSFFAAVSGSFYSRLFPCSTLHLVHCSYSAHWLSRVLKIADKEGLPLNKGKIYISKASPPEVKQAYLSQFQQDLFSFLKFRSQETAPDGRVLLILNGRGLEDPTCRNSCYKWEVLSQAIAELIKQGLIDQEKLDNFNVPYYTPWQGEIREVVEEEGSFMMENLETVVMEIGGTSLWATPEQWVKNLRAYTEPVISMQFGENVVEKLYDKVEEIHVANCEQGREATHVIDLLVVLRKKAIQSMH